MRLINTGTFEQHEFLDEIPTYAILSHTWGEGELTLQDYAAPTREKLHGFEKVKYLCAQARKDGIHWAWLDTACIDKTSSAELSEALNSMMQWYTNAEICYAYLEDVIYDTECKKRVEPDDLVRKTMPVTGDEPILEVSGTEMSQAEPTQQADSLEYHTDPAVEAASMLRPNSGRVDEPAGHSEAAGRQAYADDSSGPIDGGDDMSIDLDSEISDTWPKNKESDQSKDDIQEAPKIGALESSRWFTRGWTLQELIAPMQVHFFGKGWKYIGSKSTLADRISHFTGIDTIVLRQEGAFRLFSVARRMSWAALRTTKRIEDMAYCLLGLFDINMPAVYGEGEKAFFRLQQEIIRNSSDETILVWSSRDGSSNSSGLASHPALFESEDNPIPLTPPAEHQPYTLTNRGLQMHVRLHERATLDEAAHFFAILNCRWERCFRGYVAIPLVQTQTADTFIRKGDQRPEIFSQANVQKLTWRMIYLEVASKITPVLGIKRSPCVVQIPKFLSERGYVLSHEEPVNAPGSWDARFATSEVTYSPREIGKVIIRNFNIESERDNHGIFLSLVTGYLDADVKLYLHVKPADQDLQTYREIINNLKVGPFHEDAQVRGFHFLNLFTQDAGRRHELCVEMKLEELLETKVRWIELSTFEVHAKDVLTLDSYGTDATLLRVMDVALKDVKASKTRKDDNDDKKLFPSKNLNVERLD